MDGICDINPRTRKDCTRCRFQKCLNVGMRPDLVTNPTASNTQQVSPVSTSDGGDQSMAMMVNYHQNSNFHNPNYHYHNSNSSSMAPVQSSLVRRSISESTRIDNLNYLLNHHRIQCNRSANFSTHTNPNHSIYNPNYSNYNSPYSQSSFPHSRHLMDNNPNQVRNPHQTILSRNPTFTRMNRSQIRYSNHQSLMKNMNPNQSLMRLSGDLNQKIPRPEIPIIDTHIQGLTLNEKIKLYEMITVIHSTLLTPEDCSRFIGDTRTDLNTMTCIFISRVIRALNRLKAAEYLECADREILLRGSVGKIIFLRSIPQFDHVNKCWIVYRNPVSIPFSPNWNS